MGMHSLSRGWIALRLVMLCGLAWFASCSAQAHTPTTLQLLTEELPPLNFTEGDEIRGLSVDLVREIQRRLGKDYPIQVVPWARGYHALLAVSYTHLTLPTTPYV